MALLIGNFKLIFFYILVILVYFPTQNHFRSNTLKIYRQKTASKSLKTIFKDCQPQRAIGTINEGVRNRREVNDTIIKCHRSMY